LIPTLLLEDKGFIGESVNKYHLGKGVPEQNGEYGRPTTQAIIHMLYCRLSACVLLNFDSNLGKEEGIYAHTYYS